MSIHQLDELGSEETAHLVDGIKSVGFEFATRGDHTNAQSRSHRLRDELREPDDRERRPEQ